MATPDQIANLKRNWRTDPLWDIEDTEGFEDHREELKAYREQIEEQWRLERYDEIDRKATALRCSFELAEYLLHLESRLNQQKNID